MQPPNSHRKETILFLGGGFLFFILFFGGIILLRTGVISSSSPTEIPAKDVDQVINEMHVTITAQAAATSHTWLMVTATSLSMTVNAPTPTPTASPTPEPMTGTNRVSSFDGMVQYYVPSGEFLMGSPGDQSHAEPHEKPQHTVYLSGFWMDQTEITRGMYKQCMKSGQCFDISNDLEILSGFKDTKNDNHPIVSISWVEARNYCEKAGRRLSTEAEWEKAARGKDGRIFPWGETPVDGNLALFGKAVNGTRPVDYYKSGVSPYGILDMLGNAAEWVFDSYSDTYYSNSPAQNPFGPIEGDVKVIRGSSWKDDVSYVRITRRSFAGMNTKEDDLGFRCVSSN